MPRRWRLLVAEEPATGWWNMALDEALLASVARGAPPALRLYRWRGAWLSLGHAQSFDEERRTAWREQGVEVLRRVTGGRAVLHGADLTYAVAAPADALPEGLAGSYRAVSDALAAALRRLGVEAARAEPGARLAPDAGFDCFAEPAEDELVVEGRKLAGSAQRRVGGALLQHGSIRLAPDPPTAARLAGVGAAATSLAELGLDPEPARRALCAVLPSALADVLGADVEAGVLEPAEAADAARRAAVLERDPLARRAGPASRAP